MSLDSGNVLVSGANRGVGAALVDVALDRGAATVYAGARDLAAVPANDNRVVPVRLDVTSYEQIDEAADRLVDVDLLVCNAGVTCPGGVVAAADEVAFRDTMEVNFFANMHLVRAFAPTLRRRHGGIVFVISTAALALSRSSPMYSASKAAVLMLALGVREELRGDGVTVTVSLPGFIATDMSVAMTSPKASARQVAERTLDGWAQGAHTVWPDRFAELVRDVVGEPMQHLIDAPGATMTSVITAFGSDPAAGL